LIFAMLVALLSGPLSSTSVLQSVERS